MQYKILIAEDDESIRDGLRECLEMEDYKVSIACDGEEALSKVDEFRPDVILLDVMMPKSSGFEVCRILRKKYPDLVIIMLTAKDAESDMLTGFSYGADDYIIKPFSTLALLARIKAFIRKLTLQKDSSKNFVDETVEFCGIKLDFKKYEAEKNGIPLKLNPRELQILRMLCKRKGEVIPREELIQHIDSSTNSRTLDNYIVKLRQKLEDDPDKPRLILAVRGMGYKLDV